MNHIHYFKIGRVTVYLYKSYRGWAGISFKRYGLCRMSSVLHIYLLNYTLGINMP